MKVKNDLIKKCIFRFWIVKILKKKKRLTFKFGYFLDPLKIIIHLERGMVYFIRLFRLYIGRVSPVVCRNMNYKEMYCIVLQHWSDPLALPHSQECV